MYFYKVYTKNGIEYVETKEKLKGLIDPPPIRGIVPNREELIGMFVHFNLLNAISDQKIPSEGPAILKQWRETVDYKAEVMPQFQHFIWSLQKETMKKTLQKICRIFYLKI